MRPGGNCIWAKVIGSTIEKLLDLELSDSNEILARLRATCEEIRSLVRTQYPPSLIGYFWNMMFLSLIGKSDGDSDDGNLVAGPDEQALICAMEYVHAVVASDGLDVSDFRQAEPEVGDRIIELSKDALSQCFMFGIANSHDETLFPDYENKKLAFEILSNWVMIRGKRYQVLEEEFFSYTLKPHDDVLKELYGIGAEGIAKEIQKVSDAARAGVQRSADTLAALMEESQDAAKKADSTLEDFFPSLAEQRPEIAAQASQAIHDLFFGGTFNLSKETGLPENLLSDLAYQPGEAVDFFDGGDFSGSPFKTLPARIKPLIQIGKDYYCTEPNFVRDASYRAIQRALITRKPEYKELWNTKQKHLSESAFSDIMSGHLKSAQILNDVYYPLANGQWAETDCVIVIDDVLIVLECKAGVEPLNPPAENMQGHLKSVERLLLSAYRQCTRFLGYLNSASQVPLYAKSLSGGYDEVLQVKSSALRNIFPIGLTLESFSPFSASIKELAEVVPINGKHNFFALSIDDLMALKYILAGTGEFLHYLEVRQALAGMREVGLFDEMDHLGAYVSKNRVDQTVKEMIEVENATFVALDGFDVDVIGPFFQNPEFPNVQPRRQSYPERLLELLSALEQTGGPKWLAGDSFLRNMGSGGRDQFQTHFDRTLPILGSRDATFFATGGQVGAIFWLERSDGIDREAQAVEKAQSLILAMEEPDIMLFRIALTPNGKMATAVAKRVGKPSVIMANYGRILNEANRLRAKVTKL
jgi:hypothetical protein